MSKHQSCKNCGEDFVGPDSNIGQNLCEWCDGVIHADCHVEIASLRAENATLREVMDKAQKYVPMLEKQALAQAATIERLEGVVEKLCGPHHPDHISMRLDGFACDNCGVSIVDESQAAGSILCQSCATPEAAKGEES